MLRAEAAALARPCKYQAKNKDAGVWTPPSLPPVTIAALAHSVYRAFRLRLATAVHSDVTRSFGPSSSFETRARAIEFAKPHPNPRSSG